MGLISYKRGQGSIVLRVKILNSSVSTGAGLTGLTSASSGLIISTIADNESSATAYTVAGSTIETITTLGTYAAPTATKCRFKEVDSTNHKGVYEIQIADARFAVSSAKSLLISISGATNAAECDVVVPLTDLDPYDAVRAGLTALPNVASGSAGAIITSGTGTAQLSVSSGAVIVQNGTGTGQLSLSSGKVAATLASTDVTGNVAADLQTIKTQTVTCSAGVTVNVNVGTTQPVNFTGTAGSALVKSDVVDIAGSAVSTSSAQIGVNVVNAGGTAWASGSLTSGVFASGAITATAIAADAIGASELAADAVTEIVNAILDEDMTGHQTQGTLGQAIGDPTTGISLIARTPNAAAGASGGLLISGSNSGTTTLGALTVTGATTLTGAVALQSTLTVTGAVACNAGVTFTSSTGDAFTCIATGGNGDGAYFEGQGTGDGLHTQGGATGRGIHTLGGGTSGAGLLCVATTSGSGAYFQAAGTNQPAIGCTVGGTGAGILIMGGDTSGAGIEITTTSGDGILVTPTAGNALTLTGNGTSKHGAVITGGTAGTSDGLKLAAGTGGVGFRLDTLTTSGAVSLGSTLTVTGATTLTGTVTATDAGNDIRGVKLASTGLAAVTAWTVDITGSLSGSVGSVTGAVGSVTGAVGSVTGAVGSVTGNVGGNVTGTIGGLTAAALKDFFDTDSTTTYASAVAGSVVKEIADNAGGASLTEAGIADAVWEELIAGHSGTVGSTAEALAAASSAGDPWNTALPGAYASGKAGYIIGTYLDAAVTSRMATYTQPAGFLAATFPATVASTTNITAGTITTVTNLTNAPTSGDLTSTMKASVNAEVDTALADIHLDHLIAVADPGGVVANSSFLAKMVSKSATPAFSSFDNTTDSLEALRDRGDSAWITATGFSTHTAADVWAVATRVLTAGTNIQLPSNGLANVTAWTVDITGSLSGSVGSVTGAVGSVTGAVGSVTGNVGGNVTGSIGSLATQAKADVNAEADTALSDYGALKPTTAGRTLDVTTGGCSGIDWANIESPTTTVALSGTTVKTATDVETDTQDIQSRLPAALVNSRMDCTIDGTGMESAAVASILTTAMTESYNADGSAPTLAQALFVIMQRLTEFAINSTTITVKKLDGSTTALTLTLDDATSPTSSTRAT